MKKIFYPILLLLTFFCFGSPASAQIKNVKKEDNKKPEIVRDRFMLDFFHTFWIGTPGEINANKFHPGFNVTGMYDFKLPNGRPLSFGLGLGFSYYTLYSNATLAADTSGIMQFTAISDDISYKRNKMIYTNIHIPLEFRYRHPSGFKISLGVRVGLTTGITTRYKGNNPLNPSESISIKDFNIKNKQKFNFDVYLRTGWKFVGVYFCYEVTSLFTNGKGPQLHPMSLGLTINFF